MNKTFIKVVMSGLCLWAAILLFGGQVLHGVYIEWSYHLFAYGAMLLLLSPFIGLSWELHESFSVSRDDSSSSRRPWKIFVCGTMAIVHIGLIIGILVVISSIGDRLLPDIDRNLSACIQQDTAFDPSDPVEVQKHRSYGSLYFIRTGEVHVVSSALGERHEFLPSSDTLAARATVVTVLDQSRGLFTAALVSLCLGISALLATTYAAIRRSRRGSIAMERRHRP